MLKSLVACLLLLALTSGCQGKYVPTEAQLREKSFLNSAKSISLSIRSFVDRERKWLAFPNTCHAESVALMSRLALFPDARHNSDLLRVEDSLRLSIQSLDIISDTVTLKKRYESLNRQSDIDETQKRIDESCDQIVDTLNTIDDLLAQVEKTLK